MTNEVNGAARMANEQEEACSIERRIGSECLTETAMQCKHEMRGSRLQNACKMGRNPGRRDEMFSGGVSCHLSTP